MLALSDVRLKKGEFRLDVGSLLIEDGETVAVMGLSGSGKTTLLEVLSGLEKPDEGHVEIDGSIAFGYQNPYLQFFTESVSSEILFAMDRKKRRRGEPIVRSALARFSLDYGKYAKRSPYELSGGEARRVLLAALVAEDRDILLLDECLSGLDEDGEGTLCALLDERRKSGKTTVFSSHSSDFSAKAERLLVVSSGTIVYDGPSSNVLSHPSVAASYGLRATFDAEIAEALGIDPPESRSALEDAILARRRSC